MTYLINEECIACAACVPECADEAIYEKEETYAIDPKKCTDCGTCAEVCPVEACVAMD